VGACDCALGGGVGRGVPMVGTEDLDSMAAGLMAAELTGDGEESAGRLFMRVVCGDRATGGTGIPVRISENRPDVVFSRRCNSSELKRATPLRPCMMTCFGV
jgi:hypothetical protein